MPALPSLTRRPGPVAKERLAVNLVDLDRVEPLIRSMLLGGKLDVSAAIRMDKSVGDEVAVAFVCDVLTAACCCDTLRIRDRTRRQYPTRVYIYRERAWTKVGGTVCLTKVQAGELALNPQLFRVEVEAAPARPLAPLAVCRRPC